MSAFIDEAQLHAKGGDGGAGAVVFLREAHVARGGPDGGDGGHGGNILLVATSKVSSLLGFKDHPHRRAENGGHGGSKRKHGRNGEDTYVQVPIGTVIKSLDGDVVCELNKEGEVFVGASGGRGGHGNARFLTNRRRAPHFAEQGEVGDEIWYNLELKLMADAAIVGFPNVGKSTLISTISNAKPLVADYPFTTLRPHLGVVRVDDELSDFVVADIPGLIEGASEGKGLGHAFLRHIERARVLIILIDLSETAPKSPEDQHEILLKELEQHNEELLLRPRLIVGSKSDSDTVEHNLHLDIAISSIINSNILELKYLIANKIKESHTESINLSRVIYKPKPVGISIEKIADHAFRVTGREAMRAVNLSSVYDPDAVAVIDERLKNLRIDKILRSKGAVEGDTVEIGDFSFEWFPN